MRYTLLEIVQDVLSSMDSDEVNNINDTVESLQVVKIVKTVYDDIISRSGLVSEKLPFNLTSYGDNTKPVFMTKPTNINSIDWLRYNRIRLGDTDPAWVVLNYMPIQDFICMQQNLLPSESTVDSLTHTTDGFTFTFNYRNDIGPTYYTSFDDNTLVFDAYDSAVDTTLQSIKTLGFGTKDFTFTESNVFVPELPSDKFALLLNESKSLAWAELKQVAHPKAEQSARRNWTHLSRTRRQVPAGSLSNKAHPFAELANFGRK